MNDIVFKRIKIRTQDDDNSDEWCLASLSLEVVSKPQIRFKGPVEAGLHI